MSSCLWTKRKFLSLPYQSQHKKLTDLIKNLYFKGLEGQTWKQGCERYFIYCSWMDEKPLSIQSFEELSDAYHYHMGKSGRFLREEDFLPKVSFSIDKAYPKRKAWEIDIYLDKLRSCHNIGSIFRTCEALGIGRIVSLNEWKNLDHPQVKRTSKGCFEWVEWLCIESLEHLIRPIIVLETDDEAHCLYDFIFPKRFTLVLGNEEYGVSSKIRQLADEKVAIPMVGRKNSLNVANAFSMVASEICRQRQDGI